MESVTRWQDWSLTLGFPVMGINADGSDGTDVNAVCRSRDENLVIVADDSGHVRLFNAPVACRFAAHRAYLGHSSHCLGVGFLASQTRRRRAAAATRPSSCGRSSAETRRSTASTSSGRRRAAGVARGRDMHTTVPF